MFNAGLFGLVEHMANRARVDQNSFVSKKQLRNAPGASPHRAR